jgi:hypothetical protein
MSRTRNLIALAVAVAAVMAAPAHGDDWYRDASSPAAGAAVRPDDRAGVIGIGGIPLTSGRAKVDPLAASYLLQMGLTPDQIESWAFGTCSRQIKPAECFPSAQSTPSAQATRSGVFDWTDTAVWGGTLGLVLLIAGAVSLLAARQLRRRHVASA